MIRFLKKIHTILAVLVLAVCVQSCLFAGKDSSFAKPVEQKPTTGLNTFTISDIQGTWSCTNLLTLEEENPQGMTCEQCGPKIESEIFDVLVKGDSIWFFEYPFRYMKAVRFEIKNGDSLYFSGNAKAEGKFVKDGYGLCLHRPNNVCKTCSHVQTWWKEKHDVARMQKLVKDSIDYNYLLGHMKIIITYHPDYDGPYDVEFPVDLPRYFSLTKIDSVKKMAAVNRLYLTVNSRPRLFHATILWNRNDGDADTYPAFHLVPGDWWKGFDFFAEYSLDTGRSTQQQRKEIVQSPKKAWIELPAFKQVPNAKIQQVAVLLDSMGYISDPFMVCQQPDEYVEYKSLLPNKTGKYHYYDLNKAEQTLLRFTYKTGKEDDWELESGKKFEEIDFTPVKKVKKIYGYYFRKKGDDIRDGSVEDGVTEIWEFASPVEAAEAYKFFQKYIRNIENLHNYAYSMTTEHLLKGNCIYNVYTATGWWECSEPFKKLLESLKK